MGQKKVVSTISPKKVIRDTKKGPQFDNNNLTTLLYAIIFNQPEIVKDVLEIKNLIKDEVYAKGVAMNQDKVEFYHNEFKKLNVKARKLADLE
jgi:hypothetical protein